MEAMPDSSSALFRLICHPLNLAVWKFRKSRDQDGVDAGMARGAVLQQAVELCRGDDVPSARQSECGLHTVACLRGL